MARSDVAKISRSPIFHVNADNPEAVVKAMRMAIEFRQTFKCDVTIDLVCYRRHGHNEQDSPEITAPVMYHFINQHPTVIKLYLDRLKSQGVLTADEAADMSAQYEAHLAAEYQHSREVPSTWDNPSDTSWKYEWYNMGDESDAVAGSLAPSADADAESVLPPKKLKYDRSTGVDRKFLEQVGGQLFRIPPGFAAHKKVEAVMNNRLRAVETGDRVDWGTAEMLAFGCLLVEGVNVRLSGQDCERGTFNQRHAVLYDQVEALAGRNASYTPLKELDVARIRREMAMTRLETVPAGQFAVCNSPLSEEGVLGFEYGYSLQTPMGLTIWEAQFGDFANGAQTMIDTFIVSGEQKWQRRSGLVLSLPHGYEGQGPEHSSARIERFLQLLNEDSDAVPATADEAAAAGQRVNFHVLIPSTPAQYFHALRRQMSSSDRKPLVLFTPKSLLHHRPCTSDLADLALGTSYQRVLPPHPEDQQGMAPDDQVRKLLLCCGKIYYPLLHGMRGRGIRDVATARVEQLAPFPFAEVAACVARYPNAELVWVQEEPKNMGAYAFAFPRLLAVLQMARETRRVRYVGRPPAASPATGQYELHLQEMRAIVEEALA